MITVLVIGTCDTKLQELLYLRSQILLHPDTDVLLVEVGRTPTSHEAINVSQGELIAKYGVQDPEQQRIADLPRGEVIKYMAACAAEYIKEIHRSSAIKGIISAGGSGGTSLASAVMRKALPIGFPKLILSTVACMDMGPVVRETDITMMYSVVDIAGSNSLLKNVLSNAAGAIVGMAKSYARFLEQSSRSVHRKKRVGCTMFGVTTPCVDAVREHLESNYDVEVYVFHATGHGGRAMERLIEEKELDFVLDITTTEICDFLMGGIMSAGESRLEAAAKAGIPNILSLGATDMVNFGPRSTVPEKYQNRKLFEHNPTVTLMRTSAEECEMVASFIVNKLKQNVKTPQNVQVWLPTGGVSMIATRDGPFADPDADNVLFDTIAEGLKGTGITVVRDHRAINDKCFAIDLAEALMALAGLPRS